jgi:hypothetical protein
MITRILFSVAIGLSLLGCSSPSLNGASHQPAPKDPSARASLAAFSYFTARHGWEGGPNLIYIESPDENWEELRDVIVRRPENVVFKGGKDVEQSGDIMREKKTRTPCGLFSIKLIKATGNRATVAVFWSSGALSAKGVTYEVTRGPAGWTVTNTISSFAS